MEAYKTLETKYAEFVGSKYGVVTNTGTAALHLALVSLGIKKGDEVIVPDFTMAACGFSVSYTGAKVVTVDCKDDLTIDEEKIEEKITAKTKAIMAVHIYGRLCNMKAIVNLAKKYKLLVIEDACEAQGAVYKSKADVTCYSFFKNKIINAEEGGIMVTNNKKVYEKAQFLKNMAFDKEHSYHHAEIGFNYRMPESQAILALKSLKEFKKNFAKRKQIETWYDEYVADAWKMPKRAAVWVYDIKYPFKKDVIGKIPGVRHFFRPLSTMPMWKQEVGINASRFSGIGMYLPVNPKMTKKDVIKICSMV